VQITQWFVVNYLLIHFCVLYDELQLCDFVMIERIFVVGV
jgi:hypothetical protein